jgi:hypothetical protein
VTDKLLTLELRGLSSFLGRFDGGDDMLSELCVVNEGEPSTAIPGLLCTASSSHFDSPERLSQKLQEDL